MMTDQKHTKELWKISDDPDYPEAVILTDETMIADANIFGAGSSKKKNMANAKRIVDCVNACEGIENPQDLRTQLTAVTKQRDELREVLAEYYSGDLADCACGYEDGDVCLNCRTELLLTKTKESV